MSNNKQTMKLYTEEQLEIAMAYVHAYHESDTRLKDEEILKKLTPIQLPNDEEIREERLLQFPDSEYANRANDRLAFYCGAKWIRSKILGGNK